MEQHEHSVEHNGATHIVSYVRYIMIWIGLVMLTGLTVALSGMDLGRWIILTAFSHCLRQDNTCARHIHAPEI